MIIKTFENGDYITYERSGNYNTYERSADPNGMWRRKIKEVYTRYDKNGKFICSWWEYISPWEYIPC